MNTACTNSAPHSPVRHFSFDSYFHSFLALIPGERGIGIRGPVPVQLKTFPHCFDLSLPILVLDLPYETEPS